MSSKWYQDLFAATRLAGSRQAVHDFATTERGFRLATSVGGVLTGRGADVIIIDDPLKPDEALSEAKRQAVNNWFDHTLASRLNDKRDGIIIIIMQRLHEDDLVGHVMKQGNWTILRFPAIAEDDETTVIQTPLGQKTIFRKRGEALHPEREPLEVLARMRDVQGEYTFAGQYQQAPAPLGGGLVKSSWFKTHTSADLPAKFDMIFQSWDSANKPGELNDYSVCTTWGVKDKRIYLLHVYRKRFGYPELKRAVIEQMQTFEAKTVLIEDKASGTQLIQEFVGEGIPQIRKYEVTMDKIMRMHSVTNLIENGFVYIPDQAQWLAEYLHELATFPNGKYDDQVDSTSQALDWFRNGASLGTLGFLDYVKKLKSQDPETEMTQIPASLPCTGCTQTMTQPIPGGLRCMHCGSQWILPSRARAPHTLSRADILGRRTFRR
jgi:predicted phage terminase large subunit-like protein